MPPSIASERFEEIVKAADPVAKILGMVNSSPPTVEDDWLDCKQEPTDSNDPKQRDSKMKGMWLQALSGFSNNEGGVIIWGLDARKDRKDKKSSIDQINGVKPVNDPQGLRAKLLEWRRQATDPPVGNVQVQAYDHPREAGKGFVVCFIPEGPHKPYRTNEGDRSQYYLRTTDSFVVMSPAILRAMFYPRTRAVFHVEVEMSWEFSTRNVPFAPAHEAKVTAVVRATNKGMATAKEITVRWDHRVHKLQGLFTQMGHGWQIETGYVRCLVGMNPGMPMFEMGTWSWTAEGVIRTDHRVTPFPDDPEFRFAFYAENQEPQYLVARFSAEELADNRRVIVEASTGEPF